MAAGAFDQIIGKTIVRVAYKSNPRPPHQQVFLFFEDGTCFEVYGGEGEPIKGAKGVLEGDPEAIERGAQPEEKALWFSGEKGGEGGRLSPKARARLEQLRAKMQQSIPLSPNERPLLKYLEDREAGRIPERRND